MKRLLSIALAGAACTGAFAQGYGYPNSGYGPGRGTDSYQRNNPTRNLLAHIRRDLEFGARSVYYASRPRDRFGRALVELNKFESRLSRGWFDKGPLDSLISEMAKLSRTRELDPRLRDQMARNADEMRAFRASAGRGW